MRAGPLSLGLFVLALAATPAAGAIAFLVSQRLSTSVTGELVLVCTYEYAGRQYERSYRNAHTCPASIEVYP